MAPLQKRALYSLLIGLALATTLIVVFVTRDINTFHTDQGFRLIVYALFIGIPLVYLILVNISLRKPTQVDERDRLIMEKSSKAQLWAVIFSLVAWTIALTEVYRDQGQVPFIFMNLTLMSALIISTLAQSLGILIGYWREN